MKREAVKLYAFTRSYVLTKKRYAKVGWVKILKLEQVKLKKELINSVSVGIVIVDHERLKGPHMGERHLCGPQRHQRSPRIRKRIKVLKYRLSEKRKWSQSKGMITKDSKS